MKRLQFEDRRRSAGVDIEIRLGRPAEVPEFVDLVRRLVSTKYPGTEPDYALELATQAFGAASAGTTLRRRFYAAEARGQACAFLVASEKRNGTVKLGPLVSRPDLSSAGSGSRLLKGVVENYMQRGWAGVYATFPEAHDGVRRATREAGLDMLGIMPRLYVESSGEVIVGISRPGVVVARSVPPRMDLLPDLECANLRPNDRAAVRVGNATVGVSRKRGGAICLGPHLGDSGAVYSAVEKCLELLRGERVYAIVSTANRAGFEEMGYVASATVAGLRGASQGFFG